MSDKKPDVKHPVGYGQGEQHLGKAKVPPKEDHLPPMAGLRGEPESHISGQGGPEIMGGTSSTRILGQSVDDQLKNPLPSHDNK